MSRIVRVLFMPEVLVGLTRGRYEATYNGLPTDARIHGIAYDVDRGAVGVMLEHESFAEVAPGEFIPIAEPPAIRVLPVEPSLADRIAALTDEQCDDLRRAGWNATQGLDSRTMAAAMRLALARLLGTEERKP